MFDASITESHFLFPLRYQLYNVDVWATVAVVVLAVTYCTLRLTLALCSCLCCPRAGKSKQD